MNIIEELFLWMVMGSVLFYALVEAVYAWRCRPYWDSYQERWRRWYVSSPWRS